VARNKALLIVVSFLAGAGTAVLAPLFSRAIADRYLFPERRTEVARVLSPDGVVEAVAQRIDCGAPCSSGYAVSIVPKGTLPSRDPGKQVFLASDIANAQIRWKEPHLLDIGYDKALIQSFRNVTYPMGESGNVQSWRYAVEVRLLPTSPSFSFLAGGPSSLFLWAHKQKK
jgi:hypothetical protein